MPYHYISHRPSTVKIGTGGSAITGCTEASGFFGGSSDNQQVWQDDLPYPFDAGRHEITPATPTLTFKDYRYGTTNFTAGTVLGDDLILIFNPVYGAVESASYDVLTVTINTPRCASVEVAPDGARQGVTVSFTVNSDDGSTNPITQAFS